MTPEQRRLKAESERQRWLARKAEGIKLLGGHCVGCGSVKDLQFDHIDHNTKTMSMSRGMPSKARWLAELEKCQLLCDPCHREKSVREGDTGFQQKYGAIRHGTYTCYMKYKCKCDPCKADYKRYKREWRERRKAMGLKAW